MKTISISFAARALFAACLIQFATPIDSKAQVAPGPYEILPFEDGFIVEAFFDLLVGTGNGRADWSGWTGAYVSPNAYDGHKGTDWAVQTGTPLYAAAAGTVTETVTSFAQNQTGPTLGLGNFVRVAVDQPSPNGEALELIYGHMLSVSVTNGQQVSIGELVGLSDNNGNSTSEHLHLQSEIPTQVAVCPLYWGHFKYPIMFNPAANSQLGHIVRVTTASTPIRSDRFDTSSLITTAHQGQLYFASFPKRGYYRVFIPNNAGNRSGWIRATDVEEVFTGTVIQPLPDNVTYTHAGQLQTKYSIRSAPDDGAAQIGQILFGGGRFVADETINGYHRVPVPGAVATWGWVKPDNRMIVYPEVFNPAVDPTSIPYKDFPIIESFSAPSKSMFGRPKFNRSVVKSFSPASPGGDGLAVFVADATNAGQGLTESVLVGSPGHRNYFVQCDVYLNYQPAYVNGSLNRWERYGILLRDDGFGGMSHAFEGAGNAYAILFDSDDGRLRAGRLMEKDPFDFLSPAMYITASGWHTFRIEARENNIRYFLNGQLLREVTDNTFPAGQCGFGFYWNPNGSYPSQRGAYFDNFIADTLDPVPLRFSALAVQQDGKVRFRIHGDVGSTNRIERAFSLEPADWTFLTDIVNSNSVVEFEDADIDLPTRFYRARRLP